MATRQANRKSANNRLNLIMGLVTAGVVLLIVGFIVMNRTQSANLPGERFADQGNAHIADTTTAHPDYNSNPPTSGWHVGYLGNWGSYDYVVPDEVLLHNMEDGGVVLWYKMGTHEENRANIERLEEVSQGYRRTVIAPRQDLETPYALTAWQRKQNFEAVNETEMRAFLEAYEGIDNH